MTTHARLTIHARLTTDALHSGSRRALRSLSWLTAAQARVFGLALDVELGAGVASWHTPLHAARALQLTEPRRRFRLAARLDRLVADAHRPPFTGRRATGAVAVAPCRTSVLGCASQVADLAAILRDPAPVTAEGVARLQTLLCDGGGPLYTADRTGELQRSLHRITRLIAARD